MLRLPHCNSSFLCDGPLLFECFDSGRCGIRFHVDVVAGGGPKKTESEIVLWIPLIEINVRVKLYRVVILLPTPLTTISRKAPSQSPIINLVR